jgi:hypothetical protein
MNGILLLEFCEGAFHHRPTKHAPALEPALASQMCLVRTGGPSSWSLSLARCCRARPALCAQPDGQRHRAAADGVVPARAARGAGGGPGAQLPAFQGGAGRPVHTNRSVPKKLLGLFSSCRCPSSPSGLPAVQNVVHMDIKSR